MIVDVLPRYQATPLEALEMRLVQNTRELHAAEQALKVASELVKSEIRRLLFDREHCRVAFATLCAEHAELKKQLRSQ